MEKSEGKNFKPFEGVDPPAKKTYAHYMYLFKRTENYGMWSTKEYYLEEEEDND